MSRFILAVSLAVLLPGSVAAEQYYKWKDDNGVWNYSALPPKDKASTTVNIATGTNAQTVPEGAARGPEAGTAPPGGPPAAPAQERTMPGNADAMARIKDTQNANCERARANVATLENNPRVQINERPLSDEEQLQELQKARRQVEVFCNSQ